MEPEGGRIRAYFSLTEREHSPTAGISTERPTYDSSRCWDYDGGQDRGYGDYGYYSSFHWVGGGEGGGQRASQTGHPLPTTGMEDSVSISEHAAHLITSAWS